MAAVLKHWREAATLILVTSSKLANKGASLQLTSDNSSPSLVEPVNNFDVLLLKRSSKSKFMPNVYVFPGGAAVNSDFSTQWLVLFNKLGIDAQHSLFKQLSRGSDNASPMFTRERDQVFSIIPSEVAFRICAIRETFEESGVLLALPVEQSRSKVHLLYTKNGMPSPPPSTLNEDFNIISAWRKRVNEDPDEFLRMCLELELIPEVWSLYEWSNWLTPASAAQNRRRFDTAFFICCIDHKPDAVEDAEETVNSLWASPHSFLSAYYEQGSGLATPQIYELSRLLNFQSASDLLKLVTQPDRTRVQRWVPVPVISKTYHLEILPGDDLYRNPDEPHPTVSFVEQDDPLEELSHKYPNHHRVVVKLRNDPHPVYIVQCTILAPKGHVHPDVNTLNNIIMRIKAKL